MSLTADKLLEQVRPLTREEYHVIADAGLFDDERVELIEGVIYALAPQRSEHAIAVRKINATLLPALLGRAVCQVQLPLALGDSEPEPDFAILFEASTDELSRSEHPTRARLVIEVADTTLAKDREIKARPYSRAGIPEYWIVNLVDRKLEVYRRPAGDKYQLHDVLQSNESLVLPAFPDVQVKVKDLLP